MFDDIYYQKWFGYFENIGYAENIKYITKYTIFSIVSQYLRTIVIDNVFSMCEEKIR